MNNQMVDLSEVYRGVRGNSLMIPNTIRTENNFSFVDQQNIFLNEFTVPLHLDPRQSESPDVDKRFLDSN